MGLNPMLSILIGIGKFGHKDTQVGRHVTTEAEIEACFNGDVISKFGGKKSFY